MIVVRTPALCIHRVHLQLPDIPVWGVIPEFWGVIPDLSNLLSLIQSSYTGFDLGSRVGLVSGRTNYALMGG